MTHLEDVSVADLRDTLDSATGSKATQRLLAAIAYKHGISQTELAAWYGVERKTIYNWLTRIAEEGIADGSRDDDRPGRPSKLRADQREELTAVLQNPPPLTDWDVAAWTPELVSAYVHETFGVEYSLSSCRRLLRDAGLRYRPRDEVRVPEWSSSVEAANARGFWIPNGDE